MVLSNVNWEFYTSLKRLIPVLSVPRIPSLEVISKLPAHLIGSRVPRDCGRASLPGFEITSLLSPAFFLAARVGRIRDWILGMVPKRDFHHPHDRIRLLSFL